MCAPYVYMTITMMMVVDVCEIYGVAMEVRRVAGMGPRGGLHMLLGRHSLHKLVVWRW